MGGCLLPPLSHSHTARKERADRPARIQAKRQPGSGLPARPVCRTAAALSPEELTAQGLPFYSGALTFHTGLREKRVRVRATKLDGTSLHIGDGKSEKIIAYSPYEAETDLDGELELTAYFTRRNTFGPHHLIPQPQDGYGPDSFVTEGDQRTEDYVLVPQGFHAEVYRPDEK